MQKLNSRNIGSCLTAISFYWRWKDKLGKSYPIIDAIITIIFNILKSSNSTRFIIENKQLK